MRIYNLYFGVNILYHYVVYKFLLLMLSDVLVFNLFRYSNILILFLIYIIVVSDHTLIACPIKLPCNPYSRNSLCSVPSKSRITLYIFPSLSHMCAYVHVFFLYILTYKSWFQLTYTNINVCNFACFYFTFCI